MGSLRWAGLVVGMLATGWVRGADLKAAWGQYLGGEYVDCVVSADAALAENEYDEDWHWLRAMGHWTLGRHEAAYGAVTNSLGSAPRSLRMRWLGREVCLGTGRADEAEVWTVEILQLVEARPWNYRSAEDRVVVGQVALVKGADPKLVVERLFEPAKAVDPERREVYLAIGGLALEKHDFDLAAKVFREGLERCPDDPDLHWGLARAFAPSDPAAARASAQAALKINPRHAGTLLLLADHAIDAEDYAKAQELLGRVKSVNPWHPEAWAYEAVLAHLRNQAEVEAGAMEMALRHGPGNPGVPHLVGLKLSQKYRFAEGAALQRRALELDPAYLPARAQLAEDLLRLGEEEEGWRLAEEVHARDGYDVAALNLVTLKDVLASYFVLTNDHFHLKMAPREAELYGHRALCLLDRAREALVGKYGLTLESPVLVEMFADQKDFAVRTFGMPENHGYLGVCFGEVITANSPGSRPGQRFNWESMLWHEFCHVVTLQLSRNKMPRWLSEGISVYEERQAAPSWGERWNPDYCARVLGGEMTPVAELSGAFLAPPSPEHLQFAYFQSSLVVEYLVEQHGVEALRAILADLGKGQEINAVLQEHLGSLAEVEAGFVAFARGQAQEYGGGLDWEKPPLAAFVPERGSRDGDSRASGLDASAWAAWAKGRTNNVWVEIREAQKLVEQGELEAAEARLQPLVEACPDLTEEEGPFSMLAEIHRRRGDTGRERAALDRQAQREDSAVGAYQRLMELGEDAADWGTVRVNVDRYLAVDPLVAPPYRYLAKAAEATDDRPAAIQAYQALLRLDPANPADVHYRLARVLHRSQRPEAKRHLLQSLEDAPRNRDGLKLLLEMQQAE